MNIHPTIGVAETLLGVTGIGTPGPGRDPLRSLRLIAAHNSTDPVLANIEQGVRDALSRLDGTPGLTPHAQAEAPWLPVWTVDGDDAAWKSWGFTDEGEWTLEAEPESGPHLEVTVSGLGMHRAIALCPESARAMIAMCREWLASLEATGVPTEPEMPRIIYDDDPLARRMHKTSEKSATLRGATYRYAASIESWVLEATP